MLPLEHRIPVISDTQLVAQVVYGEGLVARLRKPNCDFHEVWAKPLELDHPWPKRRNRWIVRGQERHWREYCGDPGHAGFVTNQRSGKSRGMRHQQVVIFGNFKQICVTVAHRREDHLLDQEPGARLRLHDLFNKSLVLNLWRRHIGANGGEAQSRRFDLLAIKTHRGNQGLVPTGFQLRRDSHVWMNITIRAKRCNDDSFARSHKLSDKL